MEMMMWRALFILHLFGPLSPEQIRNAANTEGHGGLVTHPGHQPLPGRETQRTQGMESLWPPERVGEVKETSLPGADRGGGRVMKKVMSKIDADVAGEGVKSKMGADRIENGAAIDDVAHKNESETNALRSNGKCNRPPDAEHGGINYTSEMFATEHDKIRDISEMSDAGHDKIGDTSEMSDAGHDKIRYISEMSEAGHDKLRDTTSEMSDAGHDKIRDTSEMSDAGHDKIRDTSEMSDAGHDKIRDTSEMSDAGHDKIRDTTSEMSDAGHDNIRDTNEMSDAGHDKIRYTNEMSDAGHDKIRYTSSEMSDAGHDKIRDTSEMSDAGHDKIRDTSEISDAGHDIIKASGVKHDKVRGTKEISESALNEIRYFSEISDAERDKIKGAKQEQHQRHDIKGDSASERPEAATTPDVRDFDGMDKLLGKPHAGTNSPRVHGHGNKLNVGPYSNLGGAEETLDVESRRRGESRTLDVPPLRSGKTLLGTAEPERTVRRRRDDSDQLIDCGYCGRCPPPAERSDGRVNVAFMKPAYESSDQYTNRMALKKSCKAVDNVPSPVGSTAETQTCFRSANDDLRAYWMVDLQDVYTISEVILHRGPSIPVSQVSSLEKTVITVDGFLCYKFPNDRKDLRKEFPSAQLTVTCEEPKRGQWVHIQKEENVQRRLSNQWMFYCEVQIFVCTNGTFLEDGKCQPCPDPCQYDCDNFYGCKKELLFNVAMMKTTVSTPANYGHSKNAVDGRNVSPRNFQECFGSSVVENSVSPLFWQVDLEGQFFISYLLITSRMDCCGFSTNDLRILVFRSSPSVQGGSSNLGQAQTCVNWTGIFNVGAIAVLPKKFECSHPPVLGRVLKILAIHPSELLLCEVAVMGVFTRVKNAGEPGCAPKNNTLCDDRKHHLCEDNMCKVNVTGDCRLTPEFCINGTVCDRGKQDTCRQKLNEPCIPNTDSCVTSTTCFSNECKTVLAGPCVSSDNCTGGLVCDPLSTCRKRPGATCSKSEECAAGSTCERSNCVCVIGQIDEDCLSPSPTPTCGGSAACLPKEVCDTSDGMCRCQENFEKDPRDFSCKPQKLTVKGTCADSDFCREGLVCENSTCKLPIRGVCTTDDECITGAVCDIGTCRYGAGSSCNSTDSGACGISTVCEDGKCKLKVGESCPGVKDQCASPTKCSTNEAHPSKTCLLPPGHSCTEGNNRTRCVGHTSCGAGDVCRIKAGEPCGSADQWFCQKRSICQDGRCRLEDGANCTARETSCPEGLVCDALHQCRIPTTGSCKERPGGCLAGGVCSKDGPVCQCSGHSNVATPVTALCGPKAGVAGGSCVPKVNASCFGPRTRCDKTTNTCRCTEGFTIQRPTYTCGSGPGSECNTTEQCGSGMVCSAARLCQITPGNSCDENEDSCVTGTFCDVDKTCRFYLDTNCTPAPTSCKLGSVCDVVSECKIPKGGTCYYDSMCQAGAHCEESVCLCKDGVALPSPQGRGCVGGDGKVTGSCFPNATRCQDENAVCNADNKCECRDEYRITLDLECRKAIGTSCGSHKECTDGAYCDSDKHCRVSLGNPCDRNRADQCGTEALCDATNKCRLDMNGDCSDKNIIYCKAGTFCDWLHKCRLDVGQTCKFTTDCPAGAVCGNDSTCQCDQRKATIQAFICEPLVGRVGAPCAPVTKPCIVPGATCEEDVCLCRPGMEGTHDFSCSLAKSKEQEIPFNTLGLAVGLFAVAVFFMIVVVSYVHTHRAENKEVKHIREERRASMQQLTELSHASEKLTSRYAPEFTSEASVTEDSAPESSLATDMSAPSEFTETSVSPTPSERSGTQIA